MPEIFIRSILFSSWISILFSLGFIIFGFPLDFPYYCVPGIVIFASKKEEKKERKKKEEERNRYDHSLLILFCVCGILHDL